MLDEWSLKGRFATFYVVVQSVLMHWSNTYILSGCYSNRKNSCKICLSSDTGAVSWHTVMLLVSRKNNGVFQPRNNNNKLQEFICLAVFNFWLVSSSYSQNIWSLHTMHPDRHVGTANTTLQVLSFLSQYRIRRNVVLLLTTFTINTGYQHDHGNMFP